MSNETKQKNEKEELSQTNKDVDNITFAEDESKYVQKVDSSHLLIKNARYEIIEDYREAIDLEMLEKRYSNIFEKYDYIVGDISRDQLRLRGFYKNDNDRVPVDMKIFSLEDYLAEYCNFGCRYFVLKRLDPKKNFKPYKKNKKSNRGKNPSYKKGSKKNDKRPKKRTSRHKSEKPKKDRSKKSSQKSNNKRSSNQQKKSKQNFVKKERRNDSEKKTNESKSKEGKSMTDKKERFQIKKNKQK